MPDFPDSDDRLVVEADCRRCPALADCRERIAWGNGPGDADALVVGEAPGTGNPEADRWQGGNWTGMAYTSRHSGRRIRETMDRIGVDAYYTNAVKCLPCDGAGDNREPTAEELAACREHLLSELELLDPGVVVATGKHATESLLAAEGRSLDGFLDSVLDAIDCPTLGVTLVPILHPSYRDVWLSRLGYDREEYVETLRETVHAHL